MMKDARHYPSHWPAIARGMKLRRLKAIVSECCLGVIHNFTQSLLWLDDLCMGISTSANIQIEHTPEGRGEASRPMVNAGVWFHRSVQ